MTKTAGMVDRSVSKRIYSCAAFLEQAGLSPNDLEGLPARAVVDMADAFSNVFVAVTILVACCLIPAFFLPRQKAEKPVDPAALVG